MTEGMTDLQTALSTVLQETHAAVNGTGVNLEDIGSRLGFLYQQQEQAEDAEGCAQITAVWQEVQQMAEHNTNLTRHVAAMTNVANTAIQQRDNALDNLDTAQDRAEAAESELGQLNEAIDELYNEGSTSNERLSEIVDVIQDHIYDTGLHLECPGCAACDGGWYDELDHEAVNWICKALFGGYAEDLPLEVREQFAELINQAGEMVATAFEQQEAMLRASYVDLNAEPEDE